MPLSPSPSPAKKIVKRSLDRVRRNLKLQLESSARKNRLLTIAHRFYDLFQNQTMRALYLEVVFSNTFQDFENDDQIFFEINNRDQDYPVTLLCPDGSRFKTKEEWKSIIRDMAIQAAKARDFAQAKLTDWESKHWSEFKKPNHLEMFYHVQLYDFRPIEIDIDYLNIAPLSPEI